MRKENQAIDGDGRSLVGSRARMGSEDANSEGRMSGGDGVVTLSASRKSIQRGQQQSSAGLLPSDASILAVPVQGLRHRVSESWNMKCLM